MAGHAWAMNADDPAGDPAAGDPAYQAAVARRLLSPTMSGAGTTGRLSMRPGVRPHGPAPLELSGTTWIVHPHAGVLPTPGGSSTDGSYLYEEEGASGSLDPADSTHPRRDAIVQRVFDNDIDESGDLEVRPEYIAGTPGSSPAIPATPAGAIRLGWVHVPASGQGSPTLTADAPLAVGAGGILPVRPGGVPQVGYPGETIYDLGMEAYRGWHDGAWRTVASPHPAVMLVYTAPGEFDPADYPWARWLRVRVQAPGGSAGGAHATGAGEASFGAGGGAGGYCESIIPISDLTGPVTILVGNPGVTSSGGNGQDGDGPSAFGSLVVAQPGEGGRRVDAGSADAAATLWGAGGVATSGQIRIDGQPGQPGFRIGPVALSGAGGDSGMAPGGNGRGSGTAASPTSVSGTSGRLGAGGGGAVNGQNSGTTRTGGGGGEGRVIVEVY